ncbi:helix-hairpin-helix domain-containing protein [Salinarchaeum sp. IM2453]|uniref:helix-hairpin-helix domain-containing protein n=1 Tax=Salinarchaeum sp. IM2453 TaxID=2862870 RepID=UPI001C83318E|nr:helix-hairpin-helix domain-containing protein [Salinarchaeum sp. IM2453]QZA87764.1 helix-hairpin-helix domain-containing protein [Salinarchaeum sp. IM2453]
MQGYIRRLRFALGLRSPPAQKESVQITVEHEPEQDSSDATTDTNELTEINGIGPSRRDTLNDAGITSVADLVEADSAAIAEQTGISASRIDNWINQAEELLSND